MLHPLCSDKLQRYSCLFASDMLRNGNIFQHDDPYHFWNAYFLHVKDYRDLPAGKKKQYINDTRLEICTRITCEEWMHHDDGSLAHIRVFEVVRRKFLEDEAQETNAVRKLFTNRSAFLDECLQESRDDVEWKDALSTRAVEDLITLFDDLQRREQRTLSDERKDKCCSILREYISTTWDEAVTESFNAFLTTVRHGLIDAMTFGMICAYLPTKIFFIDARIHDVVVISDAYEGDITGVSENDTFVFLLFFPDTNSVECLGRVTTIVDEHENKLAAIQRCFSFTDAVVQKALDRLVAS